MNYYLGGNYEFIIILYTVYARELSFFLYTYISFIKIFHIRYIYQFKYIINNDELHIHT